MSSLGVVGGVVIWIILIFISIFVFVVAFLALASIRSKILKNLEKEIMEPKLRVTQEDLGKLEPMIASVWEKRSTVVPLPQKDHLASGFIKTETGVISIRNEICSSLKKIEEAASQFDANYARSPSMTAQDYINWLQEQEGISFSTEIAENYISFFNTARYDSHSLEFSDEDYTFFSVQFQTILSGIPPPTDQAPLAPATTILQRRQKSWNH
ncbi:hypothetical protein TVAG_315360 [Trichomonas vaginalis G3]|uniref:Uncharacterized protein n=1 Tax=Trichomonas vaginalis (strain ATCC PRA-98 / G3) TaxID=412133 RepID=A2FDK5_TRIV3|nr:hypothetical protein TVAGG3_0571620 [Trichomonas vaginalis G3]EAX97034.1 hypothetical protein TVAG_315360 [Trichomonas vaginalis G3]KAI5521948.1 hypothetical protein TVAGG3_0571620 [Trichomonas vaginalis G3]|eukprot:XP_001309964.1 hypothetical protein [Trichomonas vaginalis G3]